MAINCTITEHREFTKDFLKSLYKLFFLFQIYVSISWLVSINFFFFEEKKSQFYRIPIIVKMKFIILVSLSLDQWFELVYQIWFMHMYMLRSSEWHISSTKTMQIQTLRRKSGEFKGIFKISCNREVSTPSYTKAIYIFLIFTSSFIRGVWLCWKLVEGVLIKMSSLGKIVEIKKESIATEVKLWSKLC